MQANITPAQWSEDLIDHIKSLKKEKVFVDAIAATGIFSGIRNVDGMFVLQSGASLRETQAVVPAVAIEFDTALLNLPFPLMRCALRPQKNNQLERDHPKALVKNLLVNGYNDKHRVMNAEYVGLFADELVTVCVEVSREDLPFAEGYREYRGLFFRSLVLTGTATSGVAEDFAPVKVSLQDWTRHAEIWGLTPAEKDLWRTDALDTVRAGGLPDEDDLREAFPSLRGNGPLCAMVREQFRRAIDRGLSGTLKNHAGWARTARAALDTAVRRLKEHEKNMGVSQPWHELTVSRLLREALPDSLPLSVERQVLPSTQLARIHETRFKVRVLGPLSTPYTLTLSNTYTASGLEVLTDNPAITLR